MTVALTAYSFELIDAEGESVGALCRLLGVAEPVDWPPPFNGPETLAWIRGAMLDHPGLEGWWGYYIVADIDGAPRLVGNGGFKGPPDASGTVEIGYSLVPAYHRRGIGTEAVEFLLARAFSDPGVRSVTAETPVDFVSSRGLLEKCGFAVVSHRTDPEDGDLVMYAVRRSEAE